MSGPGTIAISILSPSAGSTVGNPITVTGSVSPASCSITCTITVGGTQYNGTVTGPDANGNWSATFPTIPSGAGTVGATAKSNGHSASTSEGITVE